MSDREDRERAVHRFFRAVDARDWDAVAAGMADPVRTDYVSLFGGEPEELSAAELVGRWRGLLPGFDATMHLLGPLLHDEDTVQCNVRGYHHLGGETWMVAGWYSLGVSPGASGPVLSGIALDISYETGPRELVERAREGAAEH